MSTPPANTAAPAVRLDDLIALHREIAALVRAGIPLELGLRGFAGGLPTRLGRLARRIADRLSNGGSLAEAVESEGPGASSIYSSVISAGIRSGRLPEALEALAASSEQVQETRRHVALALIHPTIVSVLAYFLLIGFVWVIIPIYIDSADAFGFGSDSIFGLLRWLHAHAMTLTWLIPLLIVTLLVVTYRLFRTQATWFGSSTIYRWLNQAQFAEILKIQLEHGLPLAESFVRAANSTSDPGLHMAARSVSEDLNRGIPFSEAISKTQTLPPMMRWTLVSGERQKTLVNTLKLMCDSYRRRALRQARLLKVWFPVIVTVVVSGTIALLYGLIFFGVLTSFWEGILRE